MRKLRLRPRALFMICAMIGAAAALVCAQESGTVRITVAKANVRAEPSEKSAVLTQATLGTEFELRTVEGDWFKVILNMGGMRAQAYISKKVAKLAPPPAAAPPPASAVPSAAAAEPAARADGMSVVINIKIKGSVETGWLTPHRAHAAAVADAKVDSLPSFAKSLAAGSMAPGSAMAVWVWTVDDPAVPRVVEDRRPAFVVLYRDVPGISPDDLAPMIVRLVPAAASARVIAVARGRADAATRAAADWDIVKELKQDVVKVEVEPAERGAVSLRPSADLPPGDYAIVVRPVVKKKLAGADVLSETREGRVFSVVFDFTIR